jgi:hypothetical protein
MPLLAEQLDNVVDTINQGPAALNPALFSGPIDRVLLGLKAHANTISHARLVALEESFPLTRDRLGDDIFNALSRSYIETEMARTGDANRIGAAFRDFLERHIDDQSALDLARTEWAWLESYHAAEAPPLELAFLGTLDEATLLALPISRHPAARLIELNAPLSPQLEVLGDSADAAAILVTRPGAEVRLLLLGPLDADIFGAIQPNSTVGNLLALILEQEGEDIALGPILTLIGAGALTTIGRRHEDANQVI